MSLLSKETRCPGLRRLLKVCVVIFLRSCLALLNTSCFSLFGTQGDVKSVVSVERVREQEAELDKLNMGIVFWKCCIKFRQMSGVVSPFGAVELQWSCCIWNDPQGKTNIHTKGKKIFILFHVVAVLKAFFLVYRCGHVLVSDGNGYRGAWATTALSLGNIAMSVWKTRCTSPRTKAAVENEVERFLLLFFLFLYFFGPERCGISSPPAVWKSFLPPFAASPRSPAAQWSLFFNYLVMAKVLHEAFFTLIF